MSKKNHKEIPLRYESEGIKKIISILQLLIVVYNNSSITVAIDELDAGIFEYLLGELLRIISEKGKGQLIFTSHNLRPLETLDKGFIAFTTTNPENRYLRMTNVKENNNLRDFYYRDIVLGEQDEVVYDLTNNYDIALAFREAGDM
jgi:AAA15 family ATPase/GTPase